MSQAAEHLHCMIAPAMHLVKLKTAQLSVRSMYVYV